MSEHMKNIVFTGISVTWTTAVYPKGQTAGGSLYVWMPARFPVNGNAKTATERLIA